MKIISCPCCSGKAYTSCCGVFIEQKCLPATPEELMRSRYTAYTKANIHYIAHTMKSPALDHFDPVAARKWAKAVNWLKLEVIFSSMVGEKGQVEFIAHFSQQGKNKVLHELSEFRRENNKWFYVDGAHKKDN